MVSFENGINSVIEVLGKIEGDLWLTLQQKHDGYNVSKLYKAWQLHRAQLPNDCQEYPTDFVDSDLFNLPGESVIYGEGGLNRYAVRLSGEIVASRYHAGHKIGAIQAQGIQFY